MLDYDSAIAGANNTLLGRCSSDQQTVAHSQVQADIPPADPKLTALVETEGLVVVPFSFALAFAFLAASRCFLESDTMFAEHLPAMRASKQTSHTTRYRIVL